MVDFWSIVPVLYPNLYKKVGDGKVNVSFLIHFTFAGNNGMRNHKVGDVVDF